MTSQNQDSPLRADHRWKALEAGQAAIADAGRLAPSALIAAARIAKALLEPLSITVTLLGNEHCRRYLLLEFHGGEVSTQFNLADDPKPAPHPAHPRIPLDVAAHRAALSS